MTLCPSQPFISGHWRVLRCVIAAGGDLDSCLGQVVSAVFSHCKVTVYLFISSKYLVRERDTLKCKYCFLSCLSPLVLACSHSSYLQLLLLWCLPAGDFLFSSFLFSTLAGILQGRLVPLPHVFIQLFRSVWSHRCFLLWA